MSTTPPSINAACFEQVASDYVHTSKVARPTAAMDTPTMFLKWYLVYPEAQLLSDDDVHGAQSFIADEVAGGRLALHNEAGFVMQHRCTGGDILYVCSWRGNNEVWETIYFKGLSTGSRFEVVPRETKTGTFCVWVIPVVAHEQQAWVRYLRSARDTTAQSAYFNDLFSGVVG